MLSLVVPQSLLKGRLLASATVIALLQVTEVAAQTVDAAILGSVRDAAGNALPNTAVVARNTATGVEWSVVTTPTGSFAFLQLPLGGPYTVTARRVGYRPVTRDGYALALGSRAVVEIVLEPSTTTLEPVVVAGTTGERRAPSIGANFRVGSEELTAVPAVNRNFTDLAALAPTSGVQSSLLGQRWTSTDIRIDGAQARNLLRAGDFGAGPFTLSMEAIREFEVTSASYDVTQGRQGGGSVRAATKAGTNTWTGSVFSYYRGSDLTAAHDFQARSRAQRQFSALQWGGSIGGPIARDRAHVFVAFDRWDSNEPVFSGLVQTPNDELATGIARDSLARLVNILGTSYALDTTSAQIGRLDRQPVANTIFSRLDWSLNARHRLTLTYDFSGWDSPLSGGVDQPITLFDARSNYRTNEYLSMATLQTTFVSGLQNTLKLGLSRSSRELTPNSRRRADSFACSRRCLTGHEVTSACNSAATVSRPTTAARRSCSSSTSSTCSGATFCGRQAPTTA